jgi:hypothetical protein
MRCVTFRWNAANHLHVNAVSCSKRPQFNSSAVESLFYRLLLLCLLDRPTNYTFPPTSIPAACLPIYRVSVPIPTGLSNKLRRYVNSQHKTFHVLPSEKSDVDSSAGRKTPRLENQGLGVGGAIPAEAIYSTSPSRRPHTITGGSPEAMKVRLAAMVLQPPTRV